MADPPTQKELSILPQFREAVADLYLNEEDNSDIQLLRWIRARDLDLKQAEAMLRESRKWYNENKIDRIFEWESPELFLEECPYEITGFANDGSPVIFIPLGSWNIKKITENAEKKDIYMRYVYLMFERVIREMDQRIDPSTKQKVTQFIAVFDFHNYSFRQLMSISAVNAILDSVKQFETNYPERLKAAYVIRSPRIFSILFNMVRPLLAARTLSKVEIFGYNEGKWSQVLFSSISEEGIPEFYGGTAKITVLNHRGVRNAPCSKYPS